MNNIFKTQALNVPAVHIFQSANETKSITVTQLIYGWDNVPVDIRQVASITCKVVDMVSQDVHSLYK